ncbi:YgiW/YdeI family stress tolerance OB fold protein [Desulfovibrio desulfuricans]|uniref:YgiW/YdeI family stress tolerance OB fold protein n=1 Tax=Desulfovibrio desulfuricans TaxID=876 RepID=UPI0035AF493D
MQTVRPALCTMLLCLAFGLVFLNWQTACAAGFEGPGVAATVTRAVDVLGAQDDAPCELEGHLVEKLPRRKHRYLFEDHSGQVVVEIDNKVFEQLTITPKDKVRLLGHVDWNRKRPNEVEVDSLSIIGPITAKDMPEAAPAPQKPGPARR